SYSRRDIRLSILSQAFATNALPINPFGASFPLLVWEFFHRYTDLIELFCPDFPSGMIPVAKGKSP
ncbi:MAG: hypothetical protein Q4A78_12410, partial [Peptostreptococcaceae bacterium]|nr:hypothetical protein [Peptostreptococcaceae bacterium]